jgi:3alpha(or 20beta)-hydroxysteroid dehydrogenase
MTKLEGKVAIVTGAARGQGAAEARRLVADGARVVLADVLDDAGQTVAREIGDHAVYIHLDVRDAAQWDAAVRLTLERFGRLDILVNNAAVLRFAPVAEMPMDEFRLLMDVNLAGPFLGMQAVVPPMLESGGGCIINVSSVNGIAGSPLLGAYSATKHGLIGMSRAAAMELGKSGIRVNVVCPGGVDTPMVAEAAGSVGDDVANLMVPKIPLGRIASPDEMAGMVVFLASQDASYCTGGVFVVDGGLTAGFSVA